MKVFIKGLNPCAARRTNLQQYKDYIIANGHEIVENPKEAESILIWGCGFRTDYRDNSLKQANVYKNLGKQVILGGCIPDIDPQHVKENFDGIVLNWKDDELKLEEIFHKKEMGGGLKNTSMILARGRLCKNANEYKKLNPDKDACYLDEHIQAYVSEGCMLTCSYCSEKLMFPEYQSYPLEEIVSAVAEEVKKQKLESLNEDDILVMLQADSVGDYGKDINSSLPELLERLTAIDALVKIGMQGFNPAHFIEYYDTMIDLIQRNKIFHLRLPIQNGSSKILELMGRKYSVVDIQKILEKFNEIGYTEFSTDIIIGFPGETENDFNQTVNLILKYRPKYILLSAYMDFDRLPSYELSNKVENGIKIERLKKASEIFTAHGIYCSTDGGSMTDERRDRLNSDCRI